MKSLRGLTIISLLGLIISGCSKSSSNSDKEKEALLKEMDSLSFIENYGEDLEEFTDFTADELISKAYSYCHSSLASSRLAKTTYSRDYTLPDSPYHGVTTYLESDIYQSNVFSYHKEDTIFSGSLNGGKRGTFEFIILYNKKGPNYLGP